MNPGFGLPWWLWVLVFAVPLGLLHLAAHRSERGRKRRRTPRPFPQGVRVVVKRDGSVVDAECDDDEQPSLTWFTIGDEAK